MKRLMSVLALLLGCLSGLQADQADCDVLVVGGGSAGVVAAIQAGRLGVKTIIVECGSMMGGQATVGGVNSPIMFNLHGRQVLKGIGWEWIARTVELDDGTLPESKQHWRINVPLYAVMAEELIMQAGVEIRYFEAPSRVEPVQTSADNSFNWVVTTAAMGELRTIRCKQIIDCTGSGAICALAGAERMREDTIMPGNLNYYIRTNYKVRPSEEIVQKKFNEAIENGSLLESDIPRDLMLVLGHQAATYILNAEWSSAQTRTDTNIRGRQAVMRVFRFLRSLPGGETARLVSMSPEVGVRESYRVKGEVVITVDDYVGGKIWEDSICYSAFQVDLHTDKWSPIHKAIQKDKTPTVPLRALIPAGKKNILMAGQAGHCPAEGRSGCRGHRRPPRP